MTRCRLLAAAVGAGVVLSALPVLAEPEPGRQVVDPAQASALALLERAVQAGRQLTYTGTQYVASWRQGTTSSALVELRHDPVRGSVVLAEESEREVQAAAGGPAPTAGDPSDGPAHDLADEVAEPAVTAVLDPRMLRRLAASYSLAVAGPGRCAGRAASVVTARRAGGELAGRFWVDRETGVLLRREVYDGTGRRVRSSAFVDLAVDGSSAPQPVLAGAERSGSERPAPEALDRLRGLGWHVPEQLPGGFRLFETRTSGPVLHLAYTDGLSTLSLFAQAGRLGSAPMPGFAAEAVGGRPVWVAHSAPERVVWSGGGKVWTLVSDAPDDAVRAAVAALPRDPAQDRGLRSRLARGLARLGGMLNPFG